MVIFLSHRVAVGASHQVLGAKSNSPMGGCILFVGLFPLPGVF